MRALIVDDSSAMRAFLRMILKQAGFATSEARNGREGLEALARTPLPDLVLLDWNMPEMDGFTMLRHLRADSRLPSVKVMMVTTETELAEMSKALDAGANEYVMKPFTREVLLDKLELLGFSVVAL